MPDEHQTTKKGKESHLRGWSLKDFLDHLPISAGVVCGGERMRGASDDMLRAWAWGIEDVQKNVELLIREWRSANAIES